MKTLKIATRKSPLALWQAEYVKSRLLTLDEDLNIKLVKMTSQGDRLIDTPLAKIGGKGLFLKELEEGLLAYEADLAVHSMKDVPVKLPSGLQITAICARTEPRDAFVCNDYTALKHLPDNAVIGTASLRRECQLRHHFPQFEIQPIRGNVNTRLAKLDAGEFDALILAAAGLQRLGLVERITTLIPLEQSLPAVGQGAVGIESRINDTELNQLLMQLNDDTTVACVTAERCVNQVLEGSCQVPIAAHAVIRRGELYLQALVGSPDGATILRAVTSSHIRDAQQAGYAVAQQLLDQGARTLLDELQHVGH